MIRVPFKRSIPLSHLTRRDRQAAWCALVSSVGVLYFSTAVGILHALRLDLNPVTHAVSNYAVGTFGFLMTSVFFMLALSECALAQGLGRALPRSWRARVTVPLLNLAPVGLLVTGL